VWSTAALVVSLTRAGSDELQRGAADLLRVLDLAAESGAESAEASRLAAQAAAPVHQVAALLNGEGHLWTGQSDEALIAQGQAGAHAGAMMAQHGLPLLTGLADAFATPGARMLDVGTGVAAIAVSYAQQFPELTVVGIDVLPRVLELAAQHVADSDVGGRVVLREQDVSDLDEVDTYAFAWMPAPFLPEPALKAGLDNVVTALAPGGWLMLGHGKLDGSETEVAITRFKTIAYGGTALDNDEAQSALRTASLSDVMTVPTPPGTPAATLGRKPVN
jgi:hypothetical protein